MCGISGLSGEFIPGLAARMTKIQAHRGPDGFGVFEDQAAEIALGHTRLAILDLSEAAAQPMHSLDKRYVLIFNGEIYNFRELREELVKKFNCRFRSTGDTEVLLNGFANFGPSFIERMNGIFAFALWDREKRELLLVRDPLGVKPLYYCEPKPGSLLFASEIKALFSYPGLKKEPNFLAIQEHLARGHASGKHTAFKGIYRVSPGELFRWRAADRSSHSDFFWKADLFQSTGGSYGDATESLRTSIREAVSRQMVSDVPVGSFLSGGLDSSLISLLSVKDMNQDFQSFTIIYPPSENRLDQFVDDTPYAFKVAQEMQKTQILISIKPVVGPLLKRLVWHMDEPLADPAIIASYLISAYARRNGTIVLLSGQGADELFGGYPRYTAMYLAQRLKSMFGPALPLMVRAARHIPAAFEGRYGALLRRIRRVLVELNDPPDQQFMAYCSANSDENILNVMHPDVREILKNRPSAEQSLEMIHASSGKDGNQYLLRDLFDYLPNHNLLYMDKMSMAASVEARVPLLDLDIVRRVIPMPFSWKVTGMKTKKILRDVSKGILSDEIINRPKTGFGAPYRKWLRYDLEDLWNELTSESAIKKRGWFDYKGVQEIRRVSQSGNLDLYMLQWAILTVELWARAFFDQDPTKEPV